MKLGGVEAALQARREGMIVVLIESLWQHVRQYGTGKDLFFRSRSAIAGQSACGPGSGWGGNPDHGADSCVATEAADVDLSTGAADCVREQGGCGCTGGRDCYAGCRGLR
jgi:hypothetical protein